jgi:hypothetical protein
MLILVGEFIEINLAPQLLAARYGLSTPAMQLIKPKKCMNKAVKHHQDVWQGNWKDSSHFIFILDVV